MRTRSLALMGRLSRINEARAAGEVARQRDAIESTKGQLASLRAYQASLATSQLTGMPTSGQTLRARAAFSDLSQAASTEAGVQLNRLNEGLAEALAEWGHAHQRTDVLSQREAQSRCRDKRELERRVERLVR